MESNRAVTSLVRAANSIASHPIGTSTFVTDPIAASAREIAGLSDADFDRREIAAMNFACAAGLPGSEKLDIEKCLARLDEWAEYARRKTQRALQNKSKFREYDDWPDGRYRALILQMAIQNDIGVKSNQDAIIDSIKPYDFSDSRDLFIHSVVLDLHLVICVTAPVLYAAIGRRLGYPIRLVKTKCHVFVGGTIPMASVSISSLRTQDLSATRMSIIEHGRFLGASLKRKRISG
jgi:hypothetical protein